MSRDSLLDYQVKSLRVERTDERKKPTEVRHRRALVDSQAPSKEKEAPGEDNGKTDRFSMHLQK